ncbi:MAG: Rieske 2Fe-2S domain-containing protein [Akkermansiaceae bacterium]|nr:Rieske 2Fe-2S domain-containing protein [Verrucomicrobiales bacterium]
MKTESQKPLAGRRQFCRHIMLATMTAVTGGTVWSRLIVSDLLAAEDGAGQFQLNLADYPGLNDVNGSVTLSLPNAPVGLAEIVITRAANDQFFAVDSTCAHNQCPLPPFDPTQNAIVCFCHGSRYAPNGDLLGGPAERGLRAFKATLVLPGQLRIEIPEFRFKAQARLAPEANNRIKLTFPALAFLTYRVRFRNNVSSPWEPVPFARFFNSAFDNTELTGIGRDEEIYVAAGGSAGFYSIVTA